MSMNQTTGGFFSAILIEEELKLTLPALTTANKSEIGYVPNLVRIIDTYLSLNINQRRRE
jgi:hypothetical protein